MGQLCAGQFEETQEIASPAEFQERPPTEQNSKIRKIVQAMQGYKGRKSVQSSMPKLADRTDKEYDKVTDNEMDGGVYSGQMFDGKREGLGEFKFSYGDVYKGYWVDDHMEGHGEMKYANDDFYIGDWMKSEKSGQGFYTQKNFTCEYRGAWQNDRFNGYGVEKWPQGIYKGEFSNGMKEGKGKIKFNNGKSYVGEFKLNHMHGEGVYSTANCSYTGSFKDNNFDGAGTFINKKYKYIGGFKNDKKHGAGRVEYADGRLVEGTWDLGKKNGEIKIQSSNGAVQKGEFSQGSLLRWLD